MEKYDFFATEEYPKEHIAKVQARLLEMAKIVAEVFDKNNVKYMLAFGSLLGAVREKGFVPWDDDLDFLILEEDYEAAVKCLEGNIPDWIIIQNRNTDSNYSGCWTKLRDRDTLTYSEKFVSDNCYTYRGICLDLYRMFKVPKKDVNKTILAENIDYYNRKKKVMGAMTEEAYNEKMKELVPKYQEAVKEAAASDDNTMVYAFLSLVKQHHYMNEWIFPLKKYQFEDTEFYGPNDADTALSKVYGNYMEIPPYEQRKTHYKWVKWLKNK